MFAVRIIHTHACTVGIKENILLTHIVAAACTLGTRVIILICWFNPLSDPYMLVHGHLNHRYIPLRCYETEKDWTHCSVFFPTIYFKNSVPFFVSHIVGNFCNIPFGGRYAIIFFFFFLGFSGFRRLIF